MPTIKVKFRHSSVEGREGTVFYLITHERCSRQFSTPYHIYSHEWDSAHQRVAVAPDAPRAAFLYGVQEDIRNDLKRFDKIIKSMERTGPHYSATDILDEYARQLHDYSLFNYMEKIIAKLKGSGKIRTSETYRATLNSFRKFRENRDILLDRINTALMEDYEGWLKRRGITSNTISFYNRILRAVYNRAVDADIIENTHPFRHVYTGVDKTIKRALPISVIKRIRMLDLSEWPALDFARDMFMLSFMLRGMSFVDMAYMRKSDLQDGYIFYHRRKTGRGMAIEWTEEMQLILDKYPKNESDFLFPIISRRGVSELYSYRNHSYNINHNLKHIGRILGMTLPLTLYVARHSWASAARAKGIPLGVISEGMGHDNEMTTRIYLASLDTSLVDQANAVILKSLE